MSTQTIGRILAATLSAAFVVSGQTRDKLLIAIGKTTQYNPG